MFIVICFFFNPDGHHECESSPPPFVLLIQGTPSCFAPLVLVVTRGCVGFNEMISSLGTYPTHVHIISNRQSTFNKCYICQKQILYCASGNKTFDVDALYGTNVQVTMYELQISGKIVKNN